MIAVEALIPKLFAHTLLVCTAHTLRSFNKLSNLVLECNPQVNSLSIIPVKLTPKSLSSSVLLVHTLLIFLMFVKVLCIVPSIVATFTLLIKDCLSSSLRTTTSVRLQNCLLLRIISEQGLVPKS